MDDGRRAAAARRRADGAARAGQLWIQLCEHDPADNTYVAAKILDRVHRESMTELGIGDFATRRDPTWARTVMVECPRETVPNWVGEADRVRERLNDLLQRALTTPSVTQLVGETHGMSSRSIRRHISRAVEAIREVAR